MGHTLVTDLRVALIMWRKLQPVQGCRFISWQSLGSATTTCFITASFGDTQARLLDFGLDDMASDG